MPRSSRLSSRAPHAVPRPAARPQRPAIHRGNAWPLDTRDKAALDQQIESGLHVGRRLIGAPGQPPLSNAVDRVRCVRVIIQIRKNRLDGAAAVTFIARHARGRGQRAYQRMSRGICACSTRSHQLVRAPVTQGVCGGASRQRVRRRRRRWVVPAHDEPAYERVNVKRSRPYFLTSFVSRLRSLPHRRDARLMLPPVRRKSSVT